jgi:hypothetical protein
MPFAGWLYEFEYRFARAERVYRDRRDLHRDHAWRVYEQHHDQRVECAIKKLKRNGNCRSRCAAGATSERASGADGCQRARRDAAAHSRRADTMDWAEPSA